MMRVPHTLLLDTITIENHVGGSSRGPLFAAPRTVRAAVQRVRHVTFDRHGATTVTETVAIVRPEARPVPVESRVTAGGVVYRVIRESPVPDDRRPRQVELLLERWATS